MPFLSIVTRTCRRPLHLAMCKASVTRQVDQDLEHIILRDTIGVGVAESNWLFLNAQPCGEYVMILDDDDLLATPWVVSDLKVVAEQHDPDVIVFKMRGPLGTLPGGHSWGNTPEHGRIGGSCVAVKSHVWDACIGAIATDGQGGPPVYHSDLYYLEAVWASTDRIHWMDKIVVKVPRIHGGRME